MGDRQALLAAVVADPDADLPRLVFADWLDDNGDPRWAEFIRVECELYRLTGGEQLAIGYDNQITDSRVSGLVRRSGLISGDCAATWHKLYPFSTNLSWHFGRPSRGFPDSVHLKTAKLLREKAGYIFSAGPVRRLWLERLTSLRTILELPGLARVKELHLHHCRMTERHAQEILDTNRFDHLCRLNLAGWPLTRDTADRLHERFGDRVIAHGHD